MDRIVEGMIVQHFKRELVPNNEHSSKYLYRVLKFATHTETKDRLVIYQALYNDPDNGIREYDTFARPYDMFMSEVDREKYPDIKQTYRFEEVPLPESPFEIVQLPIEKEELKFPHIEGQAAEIFYNGRWLKGTIIAGYRFRDGIVSIQTEHGVISCGEARTELYRRPIEDMIEEDIDKAFQRKIVNDALKWVEY